MEPALDSVLLSIPGGNYRCTGFHINTIAYPIETHFKTNSLLDVYVLCWVVGNLILS